MQGVRLYFFSSGLFWCLFVISSLPLVFSCTKIDSDLHWYTIEPGESRCKAPSLQLGSDYVDVWVYTDPTWKWTDPGVIFSNGGVAKIVRYSDHMNHRVANNALGYKHNNGYGVIGHFVERNTGTYDWRALDTIFTPQTTNYYINFYVMLSRSPDDEYYVCRVSGFESYINAPKNRWWSAIHFPCMPGEVTLPHPWNVGLRFDK